MITQHSLTHHQHLCIQDGRTAEAAPPGGGDDAGAPAPGHLLPHQPGLRLRLLLRLRLVRGGALRSARGDSDILIIKGVNKISRFTQYSEIVEVLVEHLLLLAIPNLRI